VSLTGEAPLSASSAFSSRFEGVVSDFEALFSKLESSGFWSRIHWIEAKISGFETGIQWILDAKSKILARIQWI